MNSGDSSCNIRWCRGILLSCAALVLSHAAVAQRSEVQFLRSWQAADRAVLEEVRGVTYAADGTLLFSERGRGALWRLAGETVTPTELAGKDRSFSSKKTGGIAVFGSGRVAVANTSNDTIALVDSQGQISKVFAGSGAGYGQLSDPEGLAASVRQRLYVADSGNNRVAVYAEDGVFLHPIGGGKDPATALVRPVQVAVDGAERVYVLENLDGGRLSVYTHTGQLLKRITSESLGGGRGARWRALAVDFREERRLAALEETDAWTGGALERAIADLEAQRLQRLTELPQRVRGRKALQKERGVERHAIDLAQAADQPRERLSREFAFPQAAPPCDEYRSAGARKGESGQGDKA